MVCRTLSTSGYADIAAETTRGRVLDVERGRTASLRRRSDAHRQRIQADRKRDILHSSISEVVVSSTSPARGGLILVSV